LEIRSNGGLIRSDLWCGENLACDIARSDVQSVGGIANSLICHAMCSEAAILI